MSYGAVTLRAGKAGKSSSGHNVRVTRGKALWKEWPAATAVTGLELSRGQFGGMSWAFLFFSFLFTGIAACIHSVLAILEFWNGDESVTQDFQGPWQHVKAGIMPYILTCTLPAPSPQMYFSFVFSCPAPIFFKWTYSITHPNCTKTMSGCK